MKPSAMNHTQDDAHVPWIAALLVLHVLSRAAFVLAGARFNYVNITTFWQILDLPLLRERLLESLVYLHAQPPVFNAMIGLALKLDAADPGWVFRRSTCLLGLRPPARPTS